MYTYFVSFNGILHISFIQIPSTKNVEIKENIIKNEKNPQWFIRQNVMKRTAEKKKRQMKWLLKCIP